MRIFKIEKSQIVTSAILTRSYIIQAESIEDAYEIAERGIPAEHSTGYCFDIQESRQVDTVVTQIEKNG